MQIIWSKLFEVKAIKTYNINKVFFQGKLMCVTVNNSSADLYNKAVDFTLRKSGEKTGTISPEEMKELAALAARGGTSQQEQEFLDSLKDQNNVEKIATVGKVTDIEPNVMDFSFSVKNGKIELKGLNKNEEIKQKNFDLLLEKGIEPQVLTDTFKYLDSVKADYSQVETLIKNQFDKSTKYKDKGWDAHDVLGAIQSFAVITDALANNVPNTQYLEQVKDDLVSGKVRVDFNTERKDMKEAHARYTFQDDTVYLKGEFDIKSDLDKSILLHEMVHTTQDIQYKGQMDVHFDKAELEAFESQGVYLAKKGVKVEEDDVIHFAAQKYGKVYNKITELKKELENTNEPNAKQALSAEIKKYEVGLKNWSEKLSDLVYDYYPTIRDILPADGIHTHK
jgi:hypothetical protein